MKIVDALKKIYRIVRLMKYKNISSTSYIARGAKIYNPDNLIMEEYTNINGGTIMNTRAKVTFKKYSGAAFGCVIITGNHMSVPGKHHKMVTDQMKNDLDVYHECDKDVIIGEDVWLGANSTLLSGVTIGRGAIIGAGAVVRSDVPPYSIVAGNPAKVVGFRFTPSITVLHEEELYPAEERLPIELLQNNYQQYYMNRINYLQDYLRL